MSITPRELRRRIEDVQDDMQDEYNAPFCEIAHLEFEVPQTPIDEEDRDDIIENFRKMGVNLPEDSIKLTVEHREFHDAMRRLTIGLSADGADASQILAAGLAIGRRIGMADAVALMGNNNKWEVD